MSLQHLSGTNLQMQRLSARPSVTRPSLDPEDDAVVYWEEPRKPKRFPTKPAAIAVFLFIVGIVFGIIGLVTSLKDSVSAAVPFLVISGLTFIPGSFHTFILVCAYLGRPGYSYDQIPNIED